MHATKWICSKSYEDNIMYNKYLIMPLYELMTDPIQYTTHFS